MFTSLTLPPVTAGRYRLGVALVVLLLSACCLPAACGQFGQYLWGEAYNSYWAYTAEPDPSGMKFRGITLSSDGAALYAIAVCGRQAPGSSSWPVGTAVHGALVVLETATGGVTRSQVLASAAGQEDEVWALARGASNATHDIVFVVGHTAGVVTGTPAGTANAGGFDMFIARLAVARANYSAAIAVEWVTQQGTVGDDVAFAVAVSPAGDAVYAAGVTTAASNNGSISTTGSFFNGFLRKFDAATGALGWNSGLDDPLNSPNTANAHDWPTALGVGPSGAVYLASRTTGNTTVNGAVVVNARSGYYDWTLTKLAASGTTLWHVHMPSAPYNSKIDDQITGISVNSAEEVLISGQNSADAQKWTIERPPFSRDFSDSYTATDFIGKFDSSGSLLWFKSLTPSSAIGWSSTDSTGDFTTTMVPGTTAGTYLMAGYSLNSPEDSSSTYSGHYVKSFVDAGSAAPVAVTTETYLTASKILPATYLSSNTVEGSFVTGVALSPTALYFCGFSVFSSSRIIGGPSMTATPFMIKLVLPPPPRKCSDMLVAGVWQCDMLPPAHG